MQDNEKVVSSSRSRGNEGRDERVDYLNSLIRSREHQLKSYLGYSGLGGDYNINSRLRSELAILRDILKVVEGKN